MRAVVQRVSEASVSIGGNVKGSIGKGFMVLLGVKISTSRPISTTYAKSSPAFGYLRTARVR